MRTDFGERELASKVIVQPDGRILVGGLYGAHFEDPWMVMVRYLPDGSLDGSFGEGGKVVSNVVGFARDIALQGDGGVLVAGTGPEGLVYEFQLARFTGNGELDTSFGNAGKVVTKFGSLDRPEALALQDDGKIVLVGESDNDLALARYRPDGSLDTTFDGDGKVTTDMGLVDSPTSAVIQADGKILVGLSNRSLLVRYNADGGLDESFVQNVGVSFVGMSGIVDVAVQADGSIIGLVDSKRDFILVSVGPDGKALGQVLVDFDGRSDAGQAVELQPDGKIVVAGESSVAIGLARFVPVVVEEEPPGDGSGGGGEGGTIVLPPGGDVQPPIEIIGPGVVEITFGLPGDVPLMGDWNGDGVKTPGVYRDGIVHLRNSNTSGTGEISFVYGLPGDTPIVGDWDGDGIDTLGVVRGNQWHLRNSNTSGVGEIIFTYGLVGDEPIAGDWNGDGVDTPGVVRRSQGGWYLRDTNSTGIADAFFSLGNLSVFPLSAGGPAKAGEPYITFDAVPLSGDWDGDGIDTPGLFAGGTWSLRNSSSSGSWDQRVDFGTADGLPVVANGGQSQDELGMVEGNRWQIRVAPGSVLPAPTVDEVLELAQGAP